MAGAASVCMLTIGLGLVLCKPHAQRDGDCEDSDDDDGGSVQSGDSDDGVESGAIAQPRDTPAIVF